MIAGAEALVGPHRGKTALLDSNVLLLLFLARFNTDLALQRFKRLSGYDGRDVIALEWLVAQFRALATTAHVLTEVSNLTNTLTGRLRSEWYRWVGRNLVHLVEMNVAAEALGRSSFFRLGITDAALIHLAPDHVVVTTDWALFQQIEVAGGAAINFTHLRSLWLLA